MKAAVQIWNFLLEKGDHVLQGFQTIAAYKPFSMKFLFEITARKFRVKIAYECSDGPRQPVRRFCKFRAVSTIMLRQTCQQGALFGQRKKFRATLGLGLSKDTQNQLEIAECFC